MGEINQTLMLTAPFCSRGFGVGFGYPNPLEKQGIWNTREIHKFKSPHVKSR